MRLRLIGLFSAGRAVVAVAMMIFVAGLLAACGAASPPAPGPSSPTADEGTVVLARTFPSSATTGVPPDTALSDYTGPCLIQEDGTVIDAKIIRCELRVFAHDVVIKNSLINGSVYTDSQAGEGSFTITDSKVDVGQGEGTGIGDVEFVATRVEVVGGSRSVNCYRNCTVQDSFVHGQFHDTSGKAHESGIRMNTNSTLLRNTISCDAPDFPPDGGCSAAITGYPDFDPVENVTVEGNLIKSGPSGYCVYGGSTAGKKFSGRTNNIRFTDNVWERGTQQGEGGRGLVCGRWGPVTSFDSSAPGNVWTGNVYDDGSPVDPAN